ncbi:MAG: Ribosomal protein S11 [candidate division TM6 bacterium GW2011_GWF2_32_72]|nr:MAG: Ribosomal protein S11 [candidate division TM6 bacterium GW2011_GWF2_32_72]
MAYKKKSKKTKRQLDSAIVHVKSTFNNTLVTVSTMDGDVVLSGSAGALGYKGSRKSTPFVATQIGVKVAKEMVDMGVKSVEVNLQGPGSARDSVVRAVMGQGVNVSVIRDVTPLPHNGCRPPKKRRV